MKAIQILATPDQGELVLEKLRKAFTEQKVSLAVVRDVHSPEEDSGEPDSFNITGETTQAKINRRFTLPELYDLSAADLFICLHTDAPEIPTLEVSSDFSEDWHPAALGQIAWPNKARLRNGRQFSLPNEMASFARALFEVSFSLLPGLNCGKCGRKDCATLLSEIVQGKAGPGDCKIESKGVTLEVDGRYLPMVHFVERIIHNVVVGIAKEMKGYRDPRKIQITVRPEDEVGTPTGADSEPS